VAVTYRYDMTAPLKLRPNGAIQIYYYYYYYYYGLPPTDGHPSM